MNVIVALRYLEPEYQETLDCLADSNVPYLFCDRRGVGNMAKAYNEGFQVAYHRHNPKYVWFISNITFEKGTFEALIEGMEEAGHAALCPVYQSDHPHLRPRSFHHGEHIKKVPFVEFTCPIVRADVFRDFPLDEFLPYVYHDLDWSYRVRQAGHTLGVHLGVEIGHEYLRKTHSTHPVTLHRKRKRHRAMISSDARMKEKYGIRWKETVWPK